MFIDKKVLYCHRDIITQMVTNNVDVTWHETINWSNVGQISHKTCLMNANNATKAKNTRRRDLLYISFAEFKIKRPPLTDGHWVPSSQKKSLHFDSDFSRHVNQRWPGLKTYLGVTWPQCVNVMNHITPVLSWITVCTLTGMRVWCLFPSRNLATGEIWTMIIILLLRH